jgi:hypothetical protein
MNPHHPTKQFAAVLSFVGALGLGADTWAGPPGMTKQGDQKVLTLISRDPPWVRCNNNMQVAAELTNVYRIPVQIVPHVLAGPGAKAPAVYWGDELIAEDGGKGNGMVGYTELSDIMEIENVPKHPQVGRLMASDPKPKHDALKQAIRDVK